MKKFIIKLAAVAALAVATIVLAIVELTTKRTITGLTLIPFAVGLLWWLGEMVVNDIKDFYTIYEAAEEE